MYKNIIIVPYRNREAHLDIFIRDALPEFEKYLQPFQVVVVEQDFGKLFNRGLMLNIGFNEYKMQSQYYFTHDIDIIPKELYRPKSYGCSCSSHMNGTVNRSFPSFFNTR